MSNFDIDLNKGSGLGCRKVTPTKLFPAWIAILQTPHARQAPNRTFTTYFQWDQTEANRGRVKERVKADGPGLIERATDVED